jgi:hypothetical protein
MRKRGYVVGSLLFAVFASTAHAKDLGDILLKKGLITEEELQQAREEDKQKAAVEESKRESILAKLPKWLDMITPFGDLRNRVEGFYGDNYHAQTRYRIRARVGLNANVTDEISGTVRLATGDSNDPISTNQTLGNTFSRKSINLDWAYMTIKPGKTFSLEPGWGQIVLGKFPNMLARESELVWDDDLSPEGAFETLNLWQQREGFLRSVRLNALQWEVNEVSSGADSYIVGGQAVADTAIGSTATWSASFGDYSFQGMNRIARQYISQSSNPDGTTANSSFNNALANSNDVVTNGKQIIAYKYGFNLINAGTEVDFPNLGGCGIPAGLSADFVNNTQADGRNTGVVIGVGVGKAGKDFYHNGLKNPGDWGVAYNWEWVEKDAVVSLFSYSDFVYQQPNATQKGSTNVTGSIIRFDYMLFPNFQLTAKSHFINALDPGIATTNNGNNGKPLIGNSTLTRLQLDAALKF